MTNVYSLPASTTMTPEQALLKALEYVHNDHLRDVLIVGSDNKNRLVVLSSRMSCKDALWIAEHLRHYALHAYD